MKPVASVHDVAAYILAKHGPMSAMKLQKLVYYSQAWSLVWDDRPMFPERIEAWAHGPVAPALYERHRGQFAAERWDGDPGTLDQDARDTVDSVLAFYAHQNAQQLSDLTHSEAPWKQAREGLADGVRGSRVIPLAALMEYYSNLPAEDEAEG